MTKLSDIFNDKIPTKNEVKAFFNNGKKYNYKLIMKFEKECINLSDENLLNTKVINNLFDYLNENLIIKKGKDLENIVYELLVINDILIDKRNNSEINELYNCINYIKNRINMLLIRISDKLNLDCEGLIKQTLFNKLMDDLFNKQKLQEVLNELIDNIDILNYHNFDGEGFDELLYKKYMIAKRFNNKVLVDYYISLMKYVVMIPGIEVEKEKYIKIIRDNIFSNDSIENKNILEEKLNGLEYNEKNNRYKLTDEFIFTIDSDQTKNYDDAFSIEKENHKLIVGIHIADVVSLGYDDKVILEKQQFSTSVGYSCASLEKNKNRKTVSAFIQINDSGMIENYKFVLTTINPKYNMKFREVESILFNKNNNEEFNQLPEEIKKTFLEKINLLTEFYTLIGNRNLSESFDCRNFGELISAKLNILYGCIVSKYFEDHGYPYIYLNKSEDGSEFSMENKGFDTGFEEFKSYGRASSPIIDKASLISQILIHKFYFRRPSFRELGRYEKLLKPFENKLNSKY